MTDKELKQNSGGSSTLGNGVGEIRRITPEMQAMEDRETKRVFLTNDLDRAGNAINYCLKKGLTIPHDWVETYNKSLKELDVLNG